MSSNIANAMTEGYGTRRLDVASRTTGNDGSGVRVIGVTRQEDSVLIGQRREAASVLGANQTASNFLTTLEGLLGTPDDTGSLSGRLAEFEGRVISAANSPWDNTMLANAVEGAQLLATTLNDISSGIQDERQRADASIGQSVDQINSALEGLEQLNKRILATNANGGEIASLLDAQSQLVDEITTFIPLQSRRGSNETLQIYSNDGHVLLGDRAAKLGFDPAAGMDPHMSLANENISGLTLNDRPLRLTGTYPAFDGGQLSALFSVRDTLGPEAQARIDGVALDLASRFDQADLDSTIVPGAPGLFTDSGALASNVNEVGLAGRLRVNTVVDAGQGGAAWRLRDGLGSTIEGPSGNAVFLTAQVDALSQQATTVSTAFPVTTRSLAELVAENLTIAATARTSADKVLSQSSARFTSLDTAVAATGVDTDDELQRLLQIEQMYAANARVITVSEEMMDQLMRIAQ